LSRRFRLHEGAEVRQFNGVLKFRRFKGQDRKNINYMQNPDAEVRILKDEHFKHREGIGRWI
jgi:hypothetical protein